MKRNISICLVIVLLVGLMTTSAFAASATGPGGTARLDIMDGGTVLRWEADPNTLWPYLFTGTISFMNHGGTRYVSGGGVLGIATSGLEPVGSIASQGYDYATFEGTATDLQGTKFVVLPEVGIGIPGL